MQSEKAVIDSAGWAHKFLYTVEFREEDKFKNLAKIIIIRALLKKNENSRILNFVKSPKIKNSRKFKHAKITRSTVLHGSLQAQCHWLTHSLPPPLLRCAPMYQWGSVCSSSCARPDSRPCGGRWVCYSVLLNFNCISHYQAEMLSLTDHWNQFQLL